MRTKVSAMPMKIYCGIWTRIESDEAWKMTPEIVCSRLPPFMSTCLRMISTMAAYKTDRSPDTRPNAIISKTTRNIKINVLKCVMNISYEGMFDDTEMTNFLSMITASVNFFHRVAHFTQIHRRSTLVWTLYFHLYMKRTLNYWFIVKSW